MKKITLLLAAIFTLSITTSTAADAHSKPYVGWRAEKMQMPGMDYTVLLNGEEKVAGIMGIPEQAGEMPPNWCAYVTVDDVDATAAKIVEMGGKVCHPPMDIPEVGRSIHFTDPQGASLAAITYAMKSGDCAQ